MMLKSFALSAVLALTLAACGSTTEQRIGGAAAGAGAGALMAGPVGAVAGGALGAISAPTVVKSARRLREN